MDEVQQRWAAADRNRIRRQAVAGANSRSRRLLKGRIKGKMSVRIKLYSVEGEHVNNCRGTFFFGIPKV